MHIFRTITEIPELELISYMMLIIAEKPDLGKAIAAAIPGHKEYDRENSLIRATWEGEDTIIVWCFGHLLTLWEPEDYDEKYKTWSMDTLPFYFENWKHKVKPDPKGGNSIEKRVNQIAGLLKKADTVVNAGDIDEEGQLLVDELLEYCGWTGRTLRLDTNDPSEVAMRRALKSMTPNEKHHADGVSAYGRQLCDKTFGYNLTRYFSLVNGGKKTLPTGRVKMPTLGLVVQRDRLIEGHKKTLYYTLACLASVNGNDIPCRYVPASDNSHLLDGKILDKNYIADVERRVKGTHLSPITVTKEQKKESPPLPFNQTKLYDYCSKAWDLQPTDVAKITQNLREKHKAITYNRSDCQYLGEATFDEAPTTLPLVCKNIGSDAGQFDTTIKSRCFNDANLTAHTAIIPTQTEQDLSTFTENERKVYEVIARYYLVQFMPPAVKEVTKLNAASVDNGTIQAVSTKIVSPGYLTFLKGMTVASDDGDKNDSDATTALSELSAGSYDGDITKTAIKEQETKPPARYTQASLVEDMSSIAKYVENKEVKKLLLSKDKDKKGENGSIGTSATRHIIIGELIKAGYLKEEKNGKRTCLISTPLGREFYDVLPDSVRKVDVSAKWWYEQELIKTGELTPDAMAKDVLRTITRIIESGCGRMEHADTYSAGAIGGEAIGKCPKCKNSVVETAKGYKCVNPECKFYLSKSDKFFSSVLNKSLPAKAVSIMLSTGRIKVKNCKSKEGKTYDALILCDFSGDFPEYKFADDSQLESLGKCPKCGGSVVEKNKGFFCTNQDCHFALWKEDAFLKAFGKKYTASMVKSVLAKGRAPLKGCKSKKNPGKTFDATLCVQFDENGKPKYQLDFDNKGTNSSKPKSSGGNSKPSQTVSANDYFSDMLGI